MRTLTLIAALSCGGTNTSSTAALWSATRFDDVNDAALLQLAVARASRRRLLDAADVGAALERASAPAQPAQEKNAAELLLRAREAFVELRLGDAKNAYDAALTAALDDDRAPAEAPRIAAIFFGRALVHLASQKKRDADRDLLAAVTLDPALAPDPDVYGPPVLRAVAAAKRAHAAQRSIELKIDRAPLDAETRVDGVLLEAGKSRTVRGRGPHLLTTAKPGYRPRSKLLTLDDRARTAGEAMVLERASGALLAAQTLEAWRREPGALSGERGAMIARCLNLAQVIEATALPGGDVDLLLRNAETGEVVRTVRGRRVDWEPHAYAALAESLEGRTLEPPPVAVELTLALSAPNQVEPSAIIPLLVDFRDPGRRLRALRARCGDARAEHALDAASDGARVRMVLAAPDEETMVPCSVHGFAEDGALIVEAPQSGEISVSVVEAARPWYRRWYVWGVISTAVVGGAALAIALRTERPDDQHVLVVHGPN